MKEDFRCQLHLVILIYQTFLQQKMHKINKKQLKIII